MRRHAKRAEEQRHGRVVLVLVAVVVVVLKVVLVAEVIAVLELRLGVAGSGVTSRRSWSRQTRSLPRAPGASCPERPWHSQPACSPSCNQLRQSLSRVQCARQTRHFVRHFARRGWARYTPHSRAGRPELGARACSKQARTWGAGRRPPFEKTRAAQRLPPRTFSARRRNMAEGDAAAEREVRRQTANNVAAAAYLPGNAPLRWWQMGSWRRPAQIANSQQSCGARLLIAETMSPDAHCTCCRSRHGCATSSCTFTPVRCVWHRARSCRCCCRMHHQDQMHEIISITGLDPVSREGFDERDVARVRKDLPYVLNFAHVHATQDEVRCPAGVD